MMGYVIEVKENEAKEHDTTAIIHNSECKEFNAKDSPYDGSFTTLNLALAAAEFVAARTEKHSCAN